MNITALTGRLTRDAIVHGNGEHKALKFSIAAKYGYDTKNKKELVSFIPCVKFDPTDKMERLLTKEGKGLMVEVIGRVHQSSFEANGETIYKVEVYVDTINIIPTGKKESNGELE